MTRPVSEHLVEELARLNRDMRESEIPPLAREAQMKPVPSTLVEELARLNRSQWLLTSSLPTPRLPWDALPIDARRSWLAEARQQLENIQTVTKAELGAPLHLVKPEQAEEVGGEDDIEWSRRVVVG